VIKSETKKLLNKEEREKIIEDNKKITHKRKD
jgi:hypothetical protein